MSFDAELANLVR